MALHSRKHILKADQTCLAFKTNVISIEIKNCDQTKTKFELEVFFSQ